MASITAVVDSIIHVAIELSQSTWLVAARLPQANKPKVFRVPGGQAPALLALLSFLRGRLATRTRRLVKIICCFETGRDGFWLHRFLTGHGIDNFVLEPTSILVNRRARRAKTDRLDAEGMLRVLVAYLAGDPKACSMVRVPTPDEEDAKRPHRERQHLTRERLRIENRIEALLFTQASGNDRRFALGTATLLVYAPETGGPYHGVYRPSWIAFAGSSCSSWPSSVRLMQNVTWPAEPSPRSRCTARSLTCAASGVSATTSRRCLLARSSTAHSLTAVSLPATSASPRCPTRAATLDRDRRIGRAGNPRARTTMIQLAWLWLRYQPGSDLAEWFRKRVGTMAGRTRRIAIVAMARKLLIALWRYVETGTIPTGAEYGGPAMAATA